jgi:hydrogenase nickel incorporation protein HypA/HybF
MHEIAAMQGIVRTVLECMRQAGASRVTNVQLVLGASGHFTSDAAYQHFEALTKGTPIEDASLTIQWLPAQYQCFFCLHRFESSEPSNQVACPKCGELALEVGHQDVCSVSAIDITFENEEEDVTPFRVFQKEPEIIAHILSNECAVSAVGSVLW